MSPVPENTVQPAVHSERDDPEKPQVVTVVNIHWIPIKSVASHGAHSMAVPSPLDPIEQEAFNKWKRKECQKKFNKLAIKQLKVVFGGLAVLKETRVKDLDESKMDAIREKVFQACFAGGSDADFESANRKLDQRLRQTRYRLNKQDNK